MSNKKRYTFKYPVQLCPLPYDDIRKDDSSEAKNVMIPLEPENWKYGIYQNDGYDYNQHLVSLDDFNDESKELPKIDFNKTANMFSSFPTKFATVINEIEVDLEHDIPVNSNIDDCSKIFEVERKYDEIAIEKLKGATKIELDEDILYALNNAKEAYELSEDERLDDNFIDLADNVPKAFNCKSDAMARFFGEEINDDNSESDDDNDINFDCGFDGILDEMSYDDNGFGKKLKISQDGVSGVSVMSKSFISTLARYTEKKEKMKHTELINPVPEDMRRNMIFEELEYDEKEVDKAVDDWYNGGEKSPEKRDLKRKKEAKQYIPKIMTVPKIKKVTQERMDTQSDNRSQSSNDISFVNVSKLHIPRGKDESKEEKKDRKKNIKIAKRMCQENKKILKNAYKALSK